MAEIDGAIQEAAAEVFENWAWLSRPSPEFPRPNPNGYAFTAATNHLKSLLTRERRGEELIEQSIAGRRGETDLIPDFEPGLAEELERRLSKDERTVLIMRMASCSYDEIEETLGINEDGLKDGPARRIYHRAHKKIFGHWSEVDEEDQMDDSQDEDKDSDND